MGDSSKAWRGGQGGRTKRMGLSVRICSDIMNAGQVGGYE